MRISDWSSDVCSSDLSVGATQAANGELASRLHLDVFASADQRQNLHLDHQHDEVPCRADLFPGRRLVACAIADVVLQFDDLLVSQFAEFRHRSEEHTSELQSLMRISYAVFCLKK